MGMGVSIFFPNMFILLAGYSVQNGGPGQLMMQI